MVQLEDTREDAHKKHLEHREFISAANAAAIDLLAVTLKALLLINGGAAVAMLGFVATVSASLNHDQLALTGVIKSLQLFSFGAALSVLATGLSYLVLYFQASEVETRDYTPNPPYVSSTAKSNRWERRSKISYTVAFISAALSLVVFLCGVWSTGDIVTTAIE